MKVHLKLFSSVYHIQLTEQLNHSRLMMIIDVEYFSKKEWDKKLKQILLDNSLRDMSSELLEVLIKMDSP